MLNIEMNRMLAEEKMMKMRKFAMDTTRYTLIKRHTQKKSTLKSYRPFPFFRIRKAG